jgi:hypothetical protein
MVFNSCIDLQEFHDMNFRRQKTIVGLSDKDWASLNNLVGPSAKVNDSIILIDGIAYINRERYAPVEEFNQKP